jgi:CRISPR-associated endonuclease/helicase Cas3
MGKSEHFANRFKSLTGMKPFPWQDALYQRFFENRHDNVPASCNLPTGVGKTSVIACWLIALANGANLPRRLVYVVNRRTVVDQTTVEVEKYRHGIEVDPELGELKDFLKGPLRISTLRGQFADNREWSADPSRPAVICGTVDMIGSRLLFSGYGIGMKARPLHAGFLGQDALLVHDEAHLEPAFQTLIKSIEAEQAREPEVPWPKFRVMELTATSRGDGEAFTLTDADYKDATVRQRVYAKKVIHLHEQKDKAKLAEQLADVALKFKNSDNAILVFARTVEDVLKVRDKLAAAKLPVETLTGTMRGKERDELVENETFARFLPKVPDDATPGTVYLVCTSAGEVGVNISADHLVCDQSTFESMAQRFGRVNRFGLFDGCEIHVVYPGEWDDKHPLTVPRKKTLALLRQLNGDGSPAALGDLPLDQRTEAFAPEPTILPATDILFDAWALTTITNKLPGRPKVEPYLHGITDWQPPETHVAWRGEVEKLQPKYASDEERAERQFQDRKALAKLAEELLDEFPLKPHELLQDRMTRVREAIDTLAKSHPDAPAWLIGEDGDVTITTLHDLTLTEKRDGKTVYKIDSRYGTILLPPSVGGLNDQGMLDAKAEPPDKERSLDVADLLYLDKARTVQQRLRTDTDTPPDGMRLLRRVPLPGTGGEEAEMEYWYWFVRAGAGDDDASKSAREPVTWEDHTVGVTNALAGIAKRLFPDDKRFQDALILAAKWHDLGKKRVKWQQSIGNPEPTVWYAKSGKDPRTKRMWKPYELTDYRHEFGSLVDVEKEPDFVALSDDDGKELVLHLIAAHHGRGRPHFPVDEAFDPHGHTDLCDRIARETPRRFARLQRRYGRWGLAYLESLLRAADWAASGNPSAYLEGDQ